MKFNISKLLREYLSRIDVVSTDEMLQYEETYPNRVNELVLDITSRNKLIDPVIYDPSLKLLIDGQHRVAAFRRIGLKNIATFNVDYFSDEVSVKNWYRIVTGIDFQFINRIFDYYFTQEDSEYKKHNGISYEVILDNQKGIQLKNAFFNPFKASLFLQKLCDEIIAVKGTVELAPGVNWGSKNYNNFTIIYIHPVIGKKSVLDIARSQNLFKFQVNRHLVANRALGIYLPIDILKLPIENAKKGVHEHMLKSTPIHIGARSWHEGRFYEGKTISFFS